MFIKNKMIFLLDDGILLYILLITCFAYDAGLTNRSFKLSC